MSQQPGNITPFAQLEKRAYANYSTNAANPAYANYSANDSNPAPTAPQAPAVARHGRGYKPAPMPMTAAPNMPINAPNNRHRTGGPATAPTAPQAPAVTRHGRGYKAPALTPSLADAVNAPASAPGGRSQFVNAQSPTTLAGALRGVYNNPERITLRKSTTDPASSQFPGMPAAGTPVTTGMSTDERMHAQNKLNPSAGGTVAPVKAPPAPTESSFTAQGTGTPTADQINQFRKGTASGYDPNSKLDRAKMQALMSGNKSWADNAPARGAMSAGPQSGGIPRAIPVGGMGKSAFAMLEKEALAKGVSKLLGHAGRALGAAGSAAKASAKPAALKKIRDAGGIKAVGGRDAGKAILDKAKLVGNKRLSVGSGLQRADNAIEGSKGIQNAINYGGGTALAGGALYGSNRMGHSSGRESGLTEGVDAGMQLGIEGANAMQPGDPGFLGRLGDLFTGTASGPNSASIRSNLSGSREDLIKALLAG